MIGWRRPIATWPVDAPTRSLAFSPDGQLLAFPNFGIELRRVPNGELVRKLPDRAAQVIAFSPDGQVIAGGGMDGVIRLWRVADGHQFHTLTGHRDRIRSLAFRPDGQVLASSDATSTIRFWGVASGQLRIEQHGSEDDSVWNVAFSPDGRLLVVAGLVVRLLDGDSGQLVRQIGTTGARTASFSPDQTMLVAAGGPQVTILRLSDGQPIQQWERPYHDFSAALSPDGQYVVVGDGVPDGNLLIGLSLSHQRALELWRMRDGVRVQAIGGHTSGVSAVAFSPDGQFVASSGGDSTVRLWRVAPRSPLWDWVLPSGIVTLLAAAVIWLWGQLRGKASA